MPDAPAIRGLALATMLAVPAAAAAEGRDLGRLVRQDCGSCHGMTLRGGLGPELTPERLKGRSVEELTAVIREGRPARAMPGWGPLLKPGEAEAIARGLLSGIFLEEARP